METGGRAGNRRSKGRPRAIPRTTDLTVTVGDRALAASWTDDAPETRAALENALPVSGEATRWGDELYISASLDVPPENPRKVVPRVQDATPLADLDGGARMRFSRTGGT